MYLRISNSYLFLRYGVCQLPASLVFRLHPKTLGTMDARLKSVFLIRSIAYQALAFWLRLDGLGCDVALVGVRLTEVGIYGFQTSNHCLVIHSYPSRVQM